MQRVFVLDKNRNPLMPCHPARARFLLKNGKAKILRMYPFTIILTDREGGALQEVELKIDPGSKVTGVALVANFQRGRQAIWAANLEHKGLRIRESLEKRRALRSSRRSRKTRYRASRFDNRRRGERWLPPSLLARVHNVANLARKLDRSLPIAKIAIETVRFDMQKLVNPEICGVEYQQGELLGYEIKEYLLEKWGRACVYCQNVKVPLQVEHIVPKSKGGTNRVSNLTISCERCNLTKGNKNLEDFLRDKTVLAKIQSIAKAPLKDAAAVNATRYAIGTSLKDLEIPLSFWSGGRTKANRCKQNYSKDHWIDAVCVGESGCQVIIPPKLRPLLISACGHGSRQMCRVDMHGFPRTSAKAEKRVMGFATGDIVRANVIKGKKRGFYFGRVAIRSSGNFNIRIAPKKTVEGIHYRYCQVIHRADGYNWGLQAGRASLYKSESFAIRLENEVSTPLHFERILG